jgi:nanoRNase/pAp phosphatase (c-di-AMP/oligoRNAs hydrolase)
LKENGRDTRLPQLLLAVRGRKNALILVHNNPDPDALGAAVGIRALYRRYFELDARIVFGGIVGRAENRSMLRLLKIEILPTHKADFEACDLLTLVDTQPGFGHTAVPEGRSPEVVIDHHPARAPRSDVLYWDVGRPVGATSTIVAELFLRNHVPLDPLVATALLYGIKSDTHDLSEEATSADLAAYRELLAVADMGVLSQIEHAPVPPAYFAVFQRAIRNALVYDFAIVSHLGRIDNPDMVAEMADFLLRCEGIRWTLVSGIYHNVLHLSIRSNAPGAHAGSVAQRTVGVLGSAGGHGRMSGGQIPLGTSDRKTRQEVTMAVTDLFLDAVKAKRTLTRPLARPAAHDESDTAEFRT